MKQLGLIGRTLAHSFSAKYFAEKFFREGLSEEYSYKLYELPTIDCLKDLLESEPNLIGFNVTIPYKQQIIPYLDSLSDEAREIGAVNCVRVESDGRLVGYNTDVDGIRLTLDKLLSGDKVESALILGSGGAARAVGYVLRERAIQYRIVSRSKASGNITYDELSREVIAGNRLIINCSPVGMYPHCDEAPAIDYEALTTAHKLFDLVYNPQITRFVEKGLAQGAKAVSGLDMLYAQAESAWQIWTK